MTLLVFLSSLPLFLPAMCWATGCRCDWLCPMVGMTGCIALAGIATGGGLAALALMREMTALDSIRD